MKKNYEYLMINPFLSDPLIKNRSTLKRFGVCIVLWLYIFRCTQNLKNRVDPYEKIYKNQKLFWYTNRTKLNS